MRRLTLIDSFLELATGESRIAALEVSLAQSDSDVAAAETAHE